MSHAQAEEISAEIHYEHLHHYAFASKFVKGKNVLDLASDMARVSSFDQKIMK